MDKLTALTTDQWKYFLHGIRHHIRCVPSHCQRAPRRSIKGGLNTFSRALAAHIVNQRLVSVSLPTLVYTLAHPLQHLRIVDKFSVSPPTTSVQPFCSMPRSHRPQLSGFRVPRRTRTARRRIPSSQPHCTRYVVPLVAPSS